LQYGHQSAERLKTSINPFGPESDASVCALPNWSMPDNGGTVVPTCGPTFAVTIGAADCCAPVNAVATLTTVTSALAERSRLTFMDAPFLELPGMTVSYSLSL